MALDFSLSEEQRLIRQAARDLLRPFEPQRERLRKMIFEQRRFPQELWEAIARAGLLGAIVPPQYGGSGMGLLALVLALEEMGALGFTVPLIVVQAMDEVCLLRNGPEPLRRKFLPQMADGSLKFCFAATEATAGSNIFRIQTLARRHGDSYRVSGSKTFISGVDIADYMLLVARTRSYQEVKDAGLPKAAGLSLFIVATSSPGISLQRLPTRGVELNQFTVFFDDVEVPADHLVGDEDKGALALFKTLNPERIVVAAQGLGMTEHCLRVACAHARQRKVFGDAPIGQYQAIQHPLAEVKIQQEAARLMTYRAAWAFDADLPVAELAAYANMAKYLAAELVVTAVDRAIETLGGQGFSDDLGIAPLWETARLFRTAPVSKEMILNYVAEHVLELPRSY